MMMYLVQRLLWPLTRLGQTFDLVILDIKIPKREGTEVLHEVKKRNRDIPVILNSAYSTYKSDFSTWMADAYVVKSADLDELKDKVKELLRPDRG